MHIHSPSITYQNPVYPHSSPDPFVLKYCGEYWCYSSGLQPDGRCFGVLHSPDLVHWTRVGSAMDQLPEGHPLYWAPEVVYWNGVFYLYYSTGDEEYMHLRVATASHPAGPFIDRGIRLTDEKFAIDAHVFLDSDGTRYMFYATDFLDHERIGTGTVFDRMLDPFTLAHRPQPVTRARYDWQIFDPHREWKGGVCWHTIEGPFVLKHNGRYYQMFSGGNYQNDTYGVGYGVTGSLQTQEEWQQCCDGVKTPPVLRTVPERGVIGPGHNSVVRGPDNRTLYCVYHRWQLETSERVMAIDPLGWEDGRLVVYGPTNTPQTINLPQVSGFKEFSHRIGSCVLDDKQAALTPQPDDLSGLALAAQPLPSPSFILEVSLRMKSNHAGCCSGIGLEGSAGRLLCISIDESEQGPQVVVKTFAGEQRFPLQGFDSLVFHLLRLEVNKGQVVFTLDGDILHDGSLFRWQGQVAGEAVQVNLFSENTSSTFAGFAITVLDS
jgi:GH43 family beta-xylosidase